MQQLLKIFDRICRVSANEIKTYSQARIPGLQVKDVLGYALSGLPLVRLITDDICIDPVIQGFLIQAELLWHLRTLHQYV